ncbi:MAG: polysaccharide biosynthesis tyrosine autokinase [Candidatus Promineifilaceae bacterium]
MELKLILTLLRKWAWLLIVLAILGGAAGYYLDTQQIPVYRASAQVMVMSAPSTDSRNRYSSSLADERLADTYSGLFLIQPVLQASYDRLGYQFSPGSVSVSNPASSQLINILVRDTSPEQAADIANVLVESFKDYALELETGRFQASEESLRFQIEQTQGQISDIETALSQITSSSQRGRLENIELQIAQIEGEIIALETEISEIQTNAELDDLESALDSEIQTYEMQLELQRLEDTYAYSLAVSIDAKQEYSVAAQESAAARIDGLQDEIVELQTAILLATAGPQVTDTQSMVASKRSELEQLRSRLDVFQTAYAGALLNADSLGSANEQRIGQLQTSLSLYQQIYASLLPSYEAVRLARVQSSTQISQLRMALPPGIPLQSASYLVVGVVLGILLGSGVGFVAEYLDDTLKSPDDVTQGLGLPAIGAILQDTSFTETGIYVQQNPRTPVAEAFRVLRANLEFASVDNPLSSVVVSSPQPSDGKSTISINLATTLAQSGKRVILVDSDLRRPSLHRRLGVANVTGLTNMLLDKDGLDAIQPTEIENLSLVTSGPLPPNPSELLSSKKLDKVLALLGSVADIVVVDAPPFVVSDPSTLASKVDGMLLVVKAGSTQMSAARVVVEQLRRANANVVGAVINQIPRRGSEYYGYYYSQYTYYGIEQDNRGFFGKLFKRGTRPRATKKSLWQRLRPKKNSSTLTK